MRMKLIFGRRDEKERERNPLRGWKGMKGKRMERNEGKRIESRKRGWRFNKWTLYQSSCQFQIELKDFGSNERGIQ